MTSKNNEHRLPRVYLLQSPARHVDLSSATAFGKLTQPLFTREPRLSSATTNTELMRNIRHWLMDYTSRDYLLLIGNPVLIGLATLAASESLHSDGVVRFLKWDNARYMYDRVVVDTFDVDEKEVVGNGRDF